MFFKILKFQNFKISNFQILHLRVDVKAEDVVSVEIADDDRLAARVEGGARELAHLLLAAVVKVLHDAPVVLVKHDVRVVARGGHARPQPGHGAGLPGRGAFFLKP